MNNFLSAKGTITASLGVVGGAVASMLGGWSMALETLVTLMILDYISGFVLGKVFEKSPKSPCGGLESNAGFKGLCKKGMMLVIVVVAYRVDVLAGSNFVRNATIIGFCSNEMLSVIENAGLMGIPMPKVLTKGVEALSDIGESKKGGE